MKTSLLIHLYTHWITSVFDKWRTANLILDVLFTNRNWLKNFKYQNESWNVRVICNFIIKDAIQLYLKILYFEKA